MFEVQLNILGEWRTFTLDGYFPVVKFDDGTFRYFLCPPSKEKNQSEVNIYSFNGTPNQN